MLNEILMYLKSIKLEYIIGCIALIVLFIIWVLVRLNIKKRKVRSKKTLSYPKTCADTVILSQGQEYQHLSIGTAISIGERENQQDSLFPPKNLDADILSTNGYLSILCDGMGGMECGEVASRIVCQEIATAFYRNEYDGEFDKFIEQNVYYVDKLVVELKNADGELARAGTTMVCTLIKDDVLSWASVGDSRIYKISNSTIKQLTRDHNYALQLINSGVEKEIAQANKKSQALISYIGMGGVAMLDICSSMRLNDGDIILMCSDGIYGSISDEQIVEVALSYKQDMQKVAIKILEAVMGAKKPYQDNASLIILAYNK